MMTNIKWAFFPGWNNAMSRAEYIIHNIIVCVAWTGSMMITEGFNYTDISNSAMLTLIAICLVLGLLYTLFVSVVWTNNRLRDGGVSNEFWRLLIIILGIMSVIAGVVVMVYCAVKPTEDPAIFIDEEDDDYRD